MIQLKTNLPAVGFPHEYDAIEFTADAAATISLYCVDTDLGASFSLTPVDGHIRLEDVASLLRDLTGGGLNAFCELRWEGGAQGFTLLPCRLDLEQTAAEWCPANFLGLRREVKRTYPGATERLTFYDDTTDPDTFAVRAVWANPSTGEVRTTELGPQDIPTATDADGVYYTATVSPELLRAPAAGYVLHSYTVTAGRRTASFEVVHVLDADPVTLAYENCFGAPDTFHFLGTTQEVVKPTRSSAQFAGRMRNYLVRSAPEYTSQTGLLRPDDLASLEDLCAATTVTYGDRSGPEICLTDNDYKISNDRYEGQTASVTWRYAGRSRHYAGRKHAGTFDNTFDKTFD